MSAGVGILVDRDIDADCANCGCKGYRHRLSVPIWRACADGWYKNQHQAETAARAIFTATGRQFEAYQCRFCPPWHLARAVGDEETA